MIRRLLTLAVLLLTLRGAAYAHRIDEYLQATLVSVQKDELRASLRLIPGVTVSAAVIAGIDRNGDGVFSDSEQRAYAERVLADLNLTLDGQRLQPVLVSARYPTLAQMQDGVGEIHLQYTAKLPPGSGNRRLILEDRHLPLHAAYLVNALAPTDRDISITGQTRNEQQSFYQLDYVQRNPAVQQASTPTSHPATWWTGLRQSLQAASFPSLFRLGVRHIAEGTDHLLFLLALLLPAPLLASRGRFGDRRWAGPATLRAGILRILRIVTAFTLGHSITLAIAASGLVHVPSRPIEALIAVSILVSALHALRPIFPGREAAIAAFFGLIHGLAFAATLSELGLGRWQRVLGILAFNLGIEAMQLLVVAATMPSLVLLSRTRAYPWLRIAGALFAALAALGWMGERLFHLPNPAEAVVNAAARHAAVAAVALFLLALAGRATRGRLSPPRTLHPS